jgi:hypothetical protein
MSSSVARRTRKFDEFMGGNLEFAGEISKLKLEIGVAIFSCFANSPAVAFAHT